MSSKPEEGEDGALEDAIDLPEDAPEARGPKNGSEGDDQSGSMIGDAIDDTEDLAGSDGGERNDVEQAPDAESLVNEEGAGNVLGNIQDGVRSDEETISIPDDSPSMQVGRMPLQSGPNTHTRRVPLCLPLAAKHLLSSVLALVRAQLATTDRLIEDFSRASPPRL